MFIESSRYEGEVNAEGGPHDLGDMSFQANGLGYEGEFWRDEYGRPEGRGVLTMPDGTRFEGEIMMGGSAGQSRGQGVLTWPDGRRYEGAVGWKYHKDSEGEVSCGGALDGLGYPEGPWFCWRPDGTAYTAEFLDGEVVEIVQTTEGEGT